MAALEPLDGRLIGDAELRERAGISRSKFYELKKQRFFDFLIARPAVPGDTRYCGSLVQKWLDGTARKR